MQRGKTVPAKLFVLVGLIDLHLCDFVSSKSGKFINCAF